MSLLGPGQTLKHYRLVNRIGRGGMGEVYKAEDGRLGRFVAIKVLPTETMQDQSARRRLLQEARSAAVLNHPNIVTIYSIDDHDGLDFIVMEYVEGQTLKAAIAGGPMRLPLLFEIGAQIADALAAAHSLNIIHRDIKSENILLTPSGQAKVLDFGLAKVVSPLVEELNEESPTRIDLTGEGIVLGTVPYMSPEQTRGEPLDGRTDIFSLGCVLYEAATGKLPFTGPSILSIAHNIAALNPPPPSTLRADLPPEFDLILQRALAKDRNVRYTSAAEIAAALNNLRGLSTDRFPRFAVSEPPPSDAESESFVGREPEMRQLDRFLRQAIDGSGKVVFITGEPGIGKTAIVDEFLRRARRQYPGLVFARGRCIEQYGTGEAYLPFLDAVSGLLSSYGRERTAALLRTHAPTWCLQFPAVFVSSGVWESLQQETIGASKERMLREMGDVIGAMAISPPMVLVLEDLHWADPSSIDLLRHLCQRIGDKRLLMIGTFRLEDIEMSDHPLKMCRLEMQAHKLCEEIALGSLSQEHVESYLNARFTPNAFPHDLHTLIQRKTEGHPLFTMSLVQYLVDRGDIAKLGERWMLARPLSEMDLDAPENVRSMIRKKIESLDEEDRRSLQYASVEGEEFLSTVVARLLDVDDLELEERLARIDRVHRRVVTLGEEELPDGSLATRYRFAHALYQNVLYGDLVSKRRIQLHRKVAEQLVRHHGKLAHRIASRLAMHFERGRDFGGAVEYLIHAGDNAMRLYASAEAAEHYSRALKLIDRIPDDERTDRLLTLYQKRGAAYVAMGHFQQAVEDYTEMLEQARALGSPVKESAALNALTMTLFYSHRLDEITERADEILRAAERTGSEAMRIEAMQVLALKSLGYGEVAEARSMLDEIIRGARALNNKTVLLVGLTWRGVLHFFQTEYEAAEAMLLEAQRLARELRDSFLLLESYFALGMVRGNQGRISEALSTLEEGMELAVRYGDHFWLPRMPNCVGWIHREMQDFKYAIKYDMKGFDVGREHNVLEAQANSLINLGIDYNRSGESIKTLALFHEVERIFQRDAWFRWRYNIRLQAGKCEDALARGEIETAYGYAKHLLEIATRYEAHKYIAVAHKLLAQVAVARGNLPEAEAELEAALDELRAYPVPIVEWRALSALGRLRSDADDQQGAREAFTRAADIINKIAANVEDERLRTTFLNSPPVREVMAGATRTAS